MKLGKLEEVKVPLQVVLGETEVSVKRLAQIEPGTIVELTSFAGEPISLLAAGEKIAEGEVVVIDENFGIRITRVISREDE
ncbi:MAG: FliM/FliN family flagellar motor switch protein [Spirochaetales bacterium]|nr:FliM/FliN family flagellar motor switch protein [Spirochaetales bacterium]